jgi:hypothetical protein
LFVKFLFQTFWTFCKVPFLVSQTTRLDALKAISGITQYSSALPSPLSKIHPARHGSFQGFGDGRSIPEFKSP